MSAMTDSCANFIMSVRYCCGTINCVKVLPCSTCSTFGELNIRYNKSFFFKNVALPMVSFASHRLLVVVRLTSSFWALFTCAGVMVLSIILGVACYPFSFSLCPGLPSLCPYYFVPEHPVYYFPHIMPTPLPCNIKYQYLPSLQVPPLKNNLP